MAYATIRVETRDRVGLITLDRPDVLNALNPQLMRELAAALSAFDGDDAVGALVLTGNEKAFAAGADIKDMQPKGFMDVFGEDFLAPEAETFLRCRKPVIAAVAGYALGGGCELAMMCDFILAADTARFGQPEIKLGVIPGLGGTQRLTRFVGKSKAMEMCLTGRMMDADEAERSGLVSRVVPAERLLDEAIEVAARIAGMSRPAVLMAKESVNRAFETTLNEGLRFERRLFNASFATEDKKEGMAAFLENGLPDSPTDSRVGRAPRLTSAERLAMKRALASELPWPITSRRTSACAARAGARKSTRRGGRASAPASGRSRRRSAAATRPWPGTRCALCSPC